ncbi:MULTISPECIES: tyrosine-type recombinase/integrase [Frankia]|nr:MULTISPECIES: tyrosine-type recombinase/integrase [Frankia]
MTIEDRWYKIEVEPGTGKRTKVKTERYGHGKRWRVPYLDPRGQRRSKSFALQGEAKDFEKHNIVDLARGMWVDPAGPKTLYKTAADNWLASRDDLSPGSMTAYAYRLRRVILPRWGDLSLAQITTPAIREWLTELAKQYMPSSITHLYIVFKSILAQAVADKLIPVSPCSTIKRGGLVMAAIAMPMPVLAAQALVDAAPEPVRLMVGLGVWAGTRQGEALGLTADRVDLLHRRLRVERQRRDRLGSPPALAPTKSKPSDRTLPISNQLVDLCDWHLSTFPPAPMEVVVFRERGREAQGKPEIVRPIFVHHHKDGDRLMSGGIWSDQWQLTYRKAIENLRAAGEPEADIAADYLAVDHKYHDLRHLFASSLIAGGANVPDVQKALGHATPTITMQTYVHLWPRSDDRVLNALHSVWSPTENSAPAVAQMSTLRTSRR